MKLNYIDSVVFDGSTRPGTVVLNGTPMSFETDDEAKFVFGLLNSQRDASISAQKFIDETRDRAGRLHSVLELRATPKSAGDDPREP